MIQQLRPANPVVTFKRSSNTAARLVPASRCEGSSRSQGLDGHRTGGGIGRYIDGTGVTPKPRRKIEGGAPVAYAPHPAVAEQQPLERR